MKNKIKSSIQEQVTEALNSAKTISYRIDSGQAPSVKELEDSGIGFAKMIIILEVMKPSENVREGIISCLKGLSQVLLWLGKRHEKIRKKYLNISQEKILHLVSLIEKYGNTTPSDSLQEKKNKVQEWVADIRKQLLNFHNEIHALDGAFNDSFKLFTKYRNKVTPLIEELYKTSENVPDINCKNEIDGMIDLLFNEVMGELNKYKKSQNIFSYLFHFASSNRLIAGKKH